MSTPTPVAGISARTGAFGPRGQLRLFAGRQPRTRRATDVLTLGVSGALVVGFGLAARPASSIERAAISFVDALPGILDGIWGAAWLALGVWATTLLVAALVRARFLVARDIAIAALVGFLVAVATADAIGGAPSIASSLGATAGPAQYPPVRLALAGAAVLVAAPHLTRPFRRVGRWVVLAAAVSAVLLGVATPTGAIIGWLVAMLAGAATRLVFGSSEGRPGLGEVRRGLQQLGIEADDVTPAARQSSGVFVVGVQRADEQLHVKVYGRDAYDTQLVAKAWRALWYRRAGASFPLTRLQQVEHEAFLLLYAARSGVSVPAVVTAGISPERDALLVLRGNAVALHDVPSADITDTVLDDVWDSVARMHAAGMVHGNLDLECIGLADGAVMLTDFGSATVIATEESTLRDIAQVFISTTVVVGEERALASARAHIDDERFAPALSYVQDAAVPPGLRRAAKGAGLDLEALRSRTAETMGVELGEPVRLRRVSRAGLIRALLLSLGAYVLLSSLGNVDLAELGVAVRDANWAWLVLGFFVGQTPRLTQAASTRVASPAPIPYGPLYALQLAVSFVNLVIPSTVARVAVNIRFFQRQGLRAATAVSVGVLDSVAEFTVQVSILLFALLTGASGIDLQLDPSSAASTGKRILIAVVVVAVVAILTVLVVPRWRNAIASTIRDWAHQARETISSMSALRIVQLLGANFATQFLFALTLSIFVAAYGTTIPILTALVVNVSAALLAGLLPIPGGIGVTEGALIYGLTAAGVDDTTAFAAVISYRIATFYLPPIWGAFAFRWLERNRYL